MTDALEDHQGTISIGGRTITNLRFADDIDGLAGKEEELESLVDRLDKNSAAFGMEICAETIWSDKHISLSSKIRLMRSLVISVLLYACETWTLTADILKKLQVTGMRCFRKLLGISYKDHITNDAVRDRIREAIGPYDDILTMGMYQDHQGLPRRFYKEQCKEEEEEADKRSVGRTTSLNGEG